MSTIGKRLIYVGPADDANHKPLHVEGVATEAGITPGMIVDYAAASAGLEISDSAATVFGVPFLIADKDQMRSRSVDDAWTINENMVAIAPRSGEFFNARVITGQALVRGTPLTHTAGGMLTVAATDGTEEIVAYAEETVTTATAAPGELVLVKRA